MEHFIQPKTFNSRRFNKYLKPAKKSNQFTNYAHAVRLLEDRARVMLKITDNKAVIATSSGTSALTAIVTALSNVKNQQLSACTQDFTFPCNKQGPLYNADIVDLDENQQMKIEDSGNSKLLIVTNCFGHLQKLDNILEYANNTNKFVIFDNAATPYSFWHGTNSCNLGTAAFVSLHHTKPIGFGEGGLVIIDKRYEKAIRSAINFNIGSYDKGNDGSNSKMSELSAAGILQWWDQFDIDRLQKAYLETYNRKVNTYITRFEETKVYRHYGDVDFFPSCLPLIHRAPTGAHKYLSESGARKYYKPLEGLPNSKKLYSSIICLPIARKINAEISSNNRLRRLFSKHIY